MANTIHPAAIIAAIALISTGAYAGPSRSLSLADAQPNERPALNDKPAAVERPKLVAPEAQTKPSVPAEKTTRPKGPGEEFPPKPASSTNCIGMVSTGRV